MNVPTLEVVISRFEEDIEWSQYLKHPLVIYNKGNSGLGIKLPNVGREPHTYLTYIIDRYETLPDYVCFCQGNPFEHCVSFMEKVNGFMFNVEYFPLGSIITFNICREYWSGYLAYWGSVLDPKIETHHDLPQIDQHMYMLDFAKKYDINVENPLVFVFGNQGIVSKNLILQRPKSFYESIIKSVSGEGNPAEVYYMEILTPSIFKVSEYLFRLRLNILRSPNILRTPTSATDRRRSNPKGIDPIYRLGNLSGLIDMVEKHLDKNSIVVETGCFEGRSTEVFALLTKHVTTIDVTFERAQKILTIYPNITPIQGSSLEEYRRFDDHSLDCVYLDALHDKEFVIKEIKYWLPKIKIGGIMSGHDYCDGWPSVVDAVNHMFGKPDYIYWDTSWVVEVTQSVLDALDNAAPMT